VWLDVLTLTNVVGKKTSKNASLVQSTTEASWQWTLIFRSMVSRANPKTQPTKTGLHRRPGIYDPSVSGRKYDKLYENFK
jgi:hypothetical protein